MNKTDCRQYFEQIKPDNAILLNKIPKKGYSLLTMYTKNIITITHGTRTRVSYIYRSEYENYVKVLIYTYNIAFKPFKKYLE